ncbi:MAG TPA: phosphatidate cytidylyltransferase, partial [Methylophaga aminisulfidivorans]|nr:phosphatidate cytidylyltransferase [Methylophaga aminisulfidivorans]
MSPNKTWEGVAGGVAFASIWAVGFYLIAEPSNMSLVSWFFISLL